jgi:DNA-binding transcriptional MerR regulator
MMTNPIADKETVSTPKVFFQSEVAALLGLPDSLVKNWTIGRPLRITPQRSAAGSGTRNLYGEEDLYRFAVAKKLSMDGFASPAIQSILDELRSELATAVFAIVTSVGDVATPWKRSVKPKVQLVSPAQFEKQWRPGAECANEMQSCYLLNVRRIVNAVNVRLASASVPSVSTNRLQQKRSAKVARPSRIFLDEESK